MWCLVVTGDFVAGTHKYLNNYSGNWPLNEHAMSMCCDNVFTLSEDLMWGRWTQSLAINSLNKTCSSIEHYDHDNIQNYLSMEQKFYPLDLISINTYHVVDVRS